MIYHYYLLVSSVVSVFLVIILFYMVVCRLGYNIQKLSPSYFELSEEQARRLAHSAIHIWNNGIIILRSLCKGKDWTLMFKVCLTIFVKFLLPKFLYNLHCSDKILNFSTKI